MRILLINPPSSEKNLIREFAPSYLKNYMNKITLVGPPHALCALAGNLKEFEVDIFDLKAEYRLGSHQSLEEAVNAKLADFKPDVAGITVLTSEYQNAITILKYVKAFNSAILTVAGGIHVTLCPGDFNLPCIDIIILGHGKKIFKDVIQAWRNKNGFSHIPNIGIHTNNSTQYTEGVNLFNDPEYLLPDIPADRSLIRKYDDAYRVGPKQVTFGYIETSLGCPNKCSFCSIWPQNRGCYVSRQPEAILNELETMRDYQLIRMADANSAGDILHICKIFDQLSERCFQNKFMIDMRAETAVKHPYLLEKAANANLIIAIVGIESLSESELQLYNKESTVDISLKAIELFQKYKIDMRASFMIRPEYGDKEFSAIENFIKENGLSHAAFSIMTPIPGTLMYKQYWNEIIIRDLDYYNFFNCVFKTKLPLEEFYGRIAVMYSKQVTVS